MIHSTFEDNISKTFHMMPYSEYWKISNTKTVQVFSEAYSSPTMLDAYTEINALPHEPDDDLECVLAPLMMWSDATHLANFGDASLWPFYLYFGNQSKYTWGKPTSSACHHMAYIPSVCSILTTICTIIDIRYIYCSFLIISKTYMLTSLVKAQQTRSTHFSNVNSFKQSGSCYLMGTSCTHMSME